MGGAKRRPDRFVSVRCLMGMDVEADRVLDATPAGDESSCAPNADRYRICFTWNDESAARGYVGVVHGVGCLLGVTRQTPSTAWHRPPNGLALALRLLFSHEAVSAGYRHPGLPCSAPARETGTFVVAADPLPRPRRGRQAGTVPLHISFGSRAFGFRPGNAHESRSARYAVDFKVPPPDQFSLRQFLFGVPDRRMEAARMDGAECGTGRSGVYGWAPHCVARPTVALRTNGAWLLTRDLTLFHVKRRPRASSAREPGAGASAVTRESRVLAEGRGPEPEARARVGAGSRES